MPEQVDKKDRWKERLGKCLQLRFHEVVCKHDKAEMLQEICQ